MNRPLFGIRILAFFAIAFAVNTAQAQEGIVIPISGGDVTIQCEATETIYFTDDNSGGTDFQDPYSNQNYTITLCPDVPGDAVQVNFLSFDLQTNANPNNNDVLYAYNGDNTGADLVGAGTGNSFVGVSITASIDNPTGCVTFQFNVNNNATGGDQGWVAEVTCVTPCSYPEAGIELASPESFPDNPISVGVCPDEIVTFDASGSLPGAPEFPVDSLIWNWGDGSVQTTAASDGFQVSHSYPTPGEYIVTLVVQDINNCNSTNLLPHQVLVSTIPIFNAEISSPLCEDAPGFLNGEPVQSITWTALPPVGVSELADLPDATGVAFTSELFIDFFDNDQVLEDCDDIELITANIEHSFIGDLSFWVTCPDGTEVLLMDNGASGGPDPTGCTPNDLGGNDLGIVDVEGFDYSWNMDAEWVLDDANNPDAASPMPAGTYLPCGDLCDFVGCPLNGIWTFNVIDQWAADNGTLFEWGIDFNPEIVPGVTTFTPIIGLESDSSYWHPIGDLDTVLDESELGVVEVSDDANNVDLEFPDPGTYEFGYYVTNNFGCSWDTTVVVEVVDNPGTFITAGPDQIFCNDPVVLEGGFDTGEESSCAAVQGSYEHCYDIGDNSIFSYCPDNPGDGTVMTINFTAGEMEGFGQDFITVYDGPDATGPILATLDLNFAGQSFTATNLDGCISFQVTSDAGFCSCGDFCGFEPLEWCVTCGGSGDACGFDWMWEPAEYFVDNTVPQPTIQNIEGEAVEFTLFVEPVGFDNCQATDVVTVEPSFQFEVESLQPSCFANDGFIQVEVLEDATADGAPFTIELYQTTGAGDNLIEAAEWDNISDFNQDDLVPGNYFVRVFDVDGCTYELPVTMNPPQPLILEVSADTLICLGGTAQISASSEDDPLNLWTYTWEALNSETPVPNGSSPIVSPVQNAVYQVNATDLNGCPAIPATINVAVNPPLTATLITEAELCPGEEAYLDGTGSTGGSGAGLTYTWTFEGGVINGNDPAIWTTPVSSGEFCVTVGDNCETPLSTACAEIDLETPLPASFFADTTRACGTGTFLFQVDTLTDLSAVSSVLWTFGDSTYANEFNTVKTFDAPGFYDVTLTVTSQSGCDNDSVADGYVWVLPLPEVNFIANPWVTRVPDTEISFTASSPSAIAMWQWTFNYPDPLGVSFDQNPVFTFPTNAGGTYPISLEVTDFNGCENIVRANVVVHDLFNLFIPNSFTPNNDGYNDAFFIEGTDIDPARFRMEVYNRWGEMIWFTTDPTDAWYGQVGDNGQHYVQSGTYSYRVEVNSLSEEDVRKEVFGHVNVIR